MNKEQILKICYKWKDAREALDYIDMKVSFTEYNDLQILLSLPTKRIKEEKPKMLHYKRVINIKQYDKSIQLDIICVELTDMFIKFLLSNQNI